MPLSAVSDKSFFLHPSHIDFGRTAKTKGGLVRTCDNFKTFDRIGMPFGINAEIDKKLHEIENPNVNAGWVAVSPDGVNIVWSVADGIRLPVELVLVSNDGGHSFQKAGVFDLEGQPVETGYLKVFSDRSRKDQTLLLFENCVLHHC